MSLIISGPYSWSGIARPGPTLPPPMSLGHIYTTTTSPTTGTLEVDS